MTVLDTSFLVSFYHTGDDNHPKAIEMARKYLHDEKILTDVILFETLTILGMKTTMETTRLAKTELLSNESIRLINFMDDERMEIVEQFLQHTGKLSVADIAVLYCARKAQTSILSFDKKLLAEWEKGRDDPSDGTHGWKEMNEWARQQAAAYKGRKEKTDHDLAAYGVSKDGSALNNTKKKRR